MQCPLCGSEISPDAISCLACGARKVTQRTPVGIFVGWAGMILGLVWTLLWAALLIMPFTEHGLSKFPWLTLVIGTLLAAGMLWYSRSTIHSKWIRRED